MTVVPRARRAVARRISRGAGRGRERSSRSARAPSMARGFVEDYRIPVSRADRRRRARGEGRDDRSDELLGMFTPASYPGTIRAWRAGHRIGASGKRVTQLAASFVVGPGPTLLYEHRNRHGADHPPLAEVLARSQDVSRRNRDDDSARTARWRSSRARDPGSASPPRCASRARARSWSGSTSRSAPTGSRSPTRRPRRASTSPTCATPRRRTPPSRRRSSSTAGSTCS